MTNPKLFHLALAALSMVPLLRAQQEPAEEADSLPEIQVTAGSYPAGALPNAVLSSLEIVLTPGANADINRALQTLPGVQLADDGNALFVRGGDSFETNTLVNGIRYPAAVRLEAPAGTYTGTINAFQAEKITFLAGGYGARYGNTLSAVVDLTTPGVPDANDGTFNLSIGAISGSASHRFGRNAGIRVTGALFDLGPLFKLYTPPREFPQAPTGHDLSAILAWNYRPGAVAKTFLLEQDSRIGVVVNEPGFHGVFRSHVRNHLGTASLNDHFAGWDVSINAGGGALHRVETIADGDVITHTSHEEFNVTAARDIGGRSRLSTGAEFNGEDFSLDDRFTFGASRTPFIFHRALREQRLGAFAEAETSPASDWLIAPGVRVDHSRLASGTTIDPRVRAAWQVRPNLGLSVAGGVYHQVADSYDYAMASAASAPFPAMRATHALASVQLGEGSRLLRIEAYEKNYSHLVELTREFTPVGGGTGRARGLDLMAKSPLPFGWRGRATWSLIQSKRTDPDTRQLVRSRQDITHSVSLLADRRWHSWNLGFAWRYASGRPFTPIVGATQDESETFAPIHGAPNSERLPAMTRIDFSASRLWAVRDHVVMVTYVAINNLFNQSNTTGYDYSEDFAKRTPAPSLFNRTAYFGVSFLFR